MESERPKATRKRRRGRGGRRRASQTSARRRAGVAAIGVLVYLLLISGVTCVLLGMLVLVSSLLVWRGLDFPLDARRGLGLIATGATLFGGGLLGVRYARRIF